MSNLKQHFYRAEIVWTGNKGIGTSTYRAYGREYTFKSDQKLEILCSSDPSFLGDASRYNPEELFLSCIAGCHMLWYLHLCAESGIIVTAYNDHATAILIELADGSGKFEEVCLNPSVYISESSDKQLAIDLHERANRFCFIANSLNFKIRHNPQIYLGPI